MARAFAAPSRLAVVAALAWTACSDWRAQVVPDLAVAEPRQTVADGEAAIPFAREGMSAELRPRARYATKAWVVAVDTDMQDGLEAIMSVDVALAWGPVARPEVLRSMSFHLARRYVSVRWDRALPIEAPAVMEHLSNHHLIPATPALEASLRALRPGDLVELEGWLVDVVARGTTKRTSLSRKDVGNGACEILYVERAHRARAGA